ncbi:MAG: M28 family peptidase, partial [Alistipes sp.]|nr:M28 family peptidase [Candidatus Minthomonas equi]
MKRISLFFSVILVSFCHLAAQETDCPRRLRESVEYLTSDNLAGRKVGTDGELAAAQYVYDRFEESGLVMLSDRMGQDFTIVSERGESIVSRNVVGIVEGYDPELKNEFIVVGANIDHIGTNVINRDGKEEFQIMPGADNNASGVACLIELARRVAASSFAFRRSVVFVGFGAGREGFAGAWYFANRSSEDIDNVSMMLNLNMVGRLGSDSPLSYCTAVPNSELTYLMGEVCRDLLIPPLPQVAGELPSADYLAFYDKNLPVMMLNTGIHPEMYS